MNGQLTAGVDDGQLSGLACRAPDCWTWWPRRIGESALGTSSWRASGARSMPGQMLQKCSAAAGWSKPLQSHCATNNSPLWDRCPLDALGAYRPHKAAAWTHERTKASPEHDQERAEQEQQRSTQGHLLLHTARAIPMWPAIVDHPPAIGVKRPQCGKPHRQRAKGKTQAAMLVENSTSVHHDRKHICSPSKAWLYRQPTYINSRQRSAIPCRRRRP